MTESATVFVVDDDPSVRESLSLLLTAVGHSVDTFSGAEEFLEAWSSDRPGCLILDVRMPGMDGLQLQRLLAERCPQVPVIMLTAHGDVTMAVDAVRSGAWHFVEKPYERQNLLGIIEEALKTDRENRSTNAEGFEVLSRMNLLTDREREVMEQLVDGKSTKIVAQILGTSPHTIAHQRASILEKMQADSVVDLTRMILLARST